jgi:hypothetical protein
MEAARTNTLLLFDGSRIRGYFGLRASLRFPSDQAPPSFDRAEMSDSAALKRSVIELYVTSMMYRPFRRLQPRNTDPSD